MSQAPDVAVDLASRWLGGTVVAASDESFGDKENLLTPGPAAFEPGRYGNRGEIVDGWETRRRRQPGHDWVIVRLGAPGTVSSVTVDTSFFTGNHPEQCAVHAAGHEGYPGAEELTGPAADWIEIVPWSPLRGDCENVFAVTDARRFTHVRLSAHPDGGVARLRVHGQVLPDPRGLEDLTIDLLSQAYGGAVVASSDDYFSAAAALNRPGLARSMGEGWETRRRRDSGNDFVVFRLGFAGRVRRLLVDTSYFRYNASDSVAVFAADAAEFDAVLLPRTRLRPDTQHEFPVDYAGPVAAIRVDAFPDGGLSRVRAIGSIDALARRRAGYRWFNALPAAQAVTALVNGGLAADTAAEVASGRPLRESGPSGPAAGLGPSGPAAGLGPFGSAAGLGLGGAADHGALLTMLEGRHLPGTRGAGPASVQP